MLIFSNIKAKFSGLFHECYWTPLQLHLILAPSPWKKICSWSTQLNFNVLMMSHPKVKQQLRLLRKTSRIVHSWWTCESWMTSDTKLAYKPLTHPSIHRPDSEAVHHCAVTDVRHVPGLDAAHPGQSALPSAAAAGCFSPVIWRMGREHVSHWLWLGWQCWAAPLPHSLTLE